MQLLTQAILLSEVNLEIVIEVVKRQQSGFSCLTVK